VPFSIATARLEAGAIDRLARQEKGAAPLTFGPAAGDRLAAAIERAFMDRSTAERRGRLQTATGLIYYSVTKRGVTRCTMAGPGGPPRPISCPPDAARWEQY
jgi:hypothetical protein